MGHQEDLTPREKHIKEMRRLESAIQVTKSYNLKKQYGKALRRMQHDLKIYDALQRGERIGGKGENR